MTTENTMNATKPPQDREAAFKAGREIAHRGGDAVYPFPPHRFESEEEELRLAFWQGYAAGANE